MTRKDHYCCFEETDPPCGMKGKHRCCLCTKPVPEEPRIMSEKEVKEKWYKECIGNNHTDCDGILDKDAILDFFLSLRRQEHEAMRDRIEGMRRKEPTQEELETRYRNNHIDIGEIKGFNQALDRVLSEVIPKGDE